MQLTDLSTAIKNTTSLTGRYALLLEIFKGFFTHVKSQLEASQYKHWDIEVTDLTDLNEFVIFMAGREIFFNFDIETGNAGSYLGVVTAYVLDPYFDDIPNVIALFTFDGGGIVGDLTGLEDPVNLKVDAHCLTVALNICLNAFVDAEIE